MTAATIDRREVRVSVWTLALLLPALPWLALAYPVETAEVRARVGSVVALAALAGLLGLALPYYLDQTSRALRKEADSLRGFWLASLFLVQMPLLLAGGEGLGIAMLLFTLCAAILGAVPFGSEFQHGTMGGLLAQPVDRRYTWWRKMGSLGGALAVLYFVFLFSSIARTGEFDLGLALWILSVGVMAWGTTPTWTLVTRGILPGLVFSLAAPLTILLALTLVLDFVMPGPQDLWPWAMGYGLAGLGIGWRLWGRLETPDTAVTDAKGVFLPSWGVSQKTSSHHRPPFLALAVKELRLQTVTALTLLLCLGFAAARPWLSNWEWASAVSILLTYTTILLAATTMVAEERRLGTLDHVLMLPASRRLQWRIKIGVAATLSILALASLMFPLLDPNRDLRSGLVNVSLIGLSFFAIGCLASTTSRTTLRALVDTLMVFLIALWMVVAGEALGPQSARENVESSIRSDSESLNQKAAALSDADLTRLRIQLEFMDPLQSDSARWGLFLPAVLGAAAALWMARRNFIHPKDGPGRWRRAAVVNLGLVGGLTFAGAAVDSIVAKAYAERAWLVRAAETQRWTAQLSPGQRELWQRHRNDTFDPRVMVRVYDPRPEVRKDIARMWDLPLDQASRRLVVEQGRISENVRTLLRNEAAEEGDIITGSPPPEPAIPAFEDPMRFRRMEDGPRPNLPPGTMRRYGLMPPAKSPTNAPAPRNPGKQP